MEGCLDVVITHAHPDHVGALDHVRVAAPQARFHANPAERLAGTLPLWDGDTVNSLRAIATPGHTEGPSLIDESQAALLVGDCLGVVDGQLVRAPAQFTADGEQAEASLHRLLSMRGSRMLFAHGEAPTNRGPTLTSSSQTDQPRFDVGTTPRSTVLARLVVGGHASGVQVSSMKKAWGRPACSRVSMRCRPDLVSTRMLATFSTAAYPQSRMVGLATEVATALVAWHSANSASRSSDASGTTTVRQGGSACHPDAGSRPPGLGFRTNLARHFLSGSFGGPREVP